MSHKLVSQVFALLLSCLPISLYANSSSTVVAGVTGQVDIDLPSKPIHTQAQLDAYLRNTPASRSPLNWLTPAANKRFLDGIVFHQGRLGRLYLGDLSYELTREQAFTLRSVFGAQSYAMSLDARSTPRPVQRSAGASAVEASYNRLAATADQLEQPAGTIAQIYAERVAPMQTDARRSAMGDRYVELLFRAAALTFQTDHQPTYVDDMRADFSELQRRQLIERPYASDFYDALIMTGNTDEARSLHRRYALIERAATPTMRTASRITRGKPSVGR